MTESVVLAFIRRNGATRVDLLERRCGSRRGELRQTAFERLQDWGMIVRRRGGVIALPHQKTQSYLLLAVEAKLIRWRQALSQALLYRRYADESYVALPRPVAAQAFEHVSEFREAGVGLISIRDGFVEVMAKAVRCLEHDWQREFVVSRLATACSCM